MAEPNQIRVTISLDGQEFTSRMAQARKETEGLGTSAKAVDNDLARVTAQLKAMGDAAALATQQFQRVKLENAGLATTADSAGQMLRRQQDETMKLGTATQGAGRQIGFLDAAVRGAAAGFGLLGLLEVGGRIVSTGLAFDGLREKINAATGSTEAGAAGFAYVRAEANRLGLQIRDTATNYADFVAGTASSGLSRGRRDDIFSALNEAGAAYNLTQEQINQNFDQVIRIGGKAKVTLDDLAGTLGTNLPQTLDAVARGLGVTTEKLRELIKDGELAGNEVVPALADGLRQTFDTSLNTQINTTEAQFARLRGEIELSADALARFLNPTIGSQFDSLAGEIRVIREDFGSYLKFGAQDVGRGILGDLGLADREGSRPLRDERIRALNNARDYVATNPFAPQLYDPNRPAAAPFYAPGAPAPDFLTGANLLSFGQTPPDPKAQREAARLAARENREDERARAKADADALRDQQRLLDIELDREVALRKGIEDTRVRAAIVAEELRTGEALTGAARDLFELKARGRSTDQASLATELEKLAALEAQVKAQKDAEELARNAQRARDRADAANDRFLRRFGDGEDADRTTGGALRRNAQKRDRGRDVLDQEFNRNQDLQGIARSAERANGTNDEAEYRKQDLEAYRAYTDEKARIDREYHDGYIAIIRSQYDASATVFGQIADIAVLFGNKGFQAFKAFKIAEAIASTISGSIGAFNEASKAYPPPFGQILGGIAASAVLARGYAAVSQIRAAQPPGRRFGGSVAAGGLYEVTESGVPEVFRDSRTSRSYLLPGNAGEVVPLGAGGGGGAAGGGAVNLNVQVINQVANAQVRTERSTDADGRPTLRLIVAEIGRDIREGGEVSSAIRDTYGLRRAGRVL